MHEETINLNELNELCSLTDARCQSYIEAICVCLEKSGHEPEVLLKIKGDDPSGINLTWELLDSKVFLSWNDLDDAVEQAAYAVAIFAIYKKTPYKIISQSVKGGGFDFFLGEKSGDVYQHPAGIAEVSGILKGAMGRVNYRVKEKLKQANLSLG